MNKLTSIRIKQNDGTYSDDILVQVLADNVIWTQGSTVSLLDILGQVQYETKGSIQHQIDTISIQQVEDARVGADDTQYTNLKARLDDEYEDLQNKIAAVATDLRSQTGTRSNEDTAIRASISTQATTRQNNDTTLSNQIITEVNARKNGDDVLTRRISTEESARQAADNTLQSNIGAEASARQTADNTMSAQIAQILNTNGVIDIQHGALAVQAATGATNFTCTFPRAFSSVPNVIATVRVSGSTDSQTVKITSTTASNFAGTVFNAGTATVSAYVEWVATIGDADLNSEIADARIGADGTVYTSLGNAIRGQVTALEDQIGNLEDFESIENYIQIADGTFTTKGVTAVFDYTGQTVTVTGMATSGGGRDVLYNHKKITLPPGDYKFTIIPNVTNIQFCLTSIVTPFPMVINGAGVFTLEQTTDCYLGINLDSGKTVNATYKFQLENGASYTGYKWPYSCRDYEARDTADKAENALVDIVAKSPNRFDKTSSLIKDNTFITTSRYATASGLRVTHPIKVTKGEVIKFPKAQAVGQNYYYAYVNYDGTLSTTINATESALIDGYMVITAPYDGFIAVNIGRENMDGFMVCKSDEYPSTYVSYGYTTTDKLTVVDTNVLYGKTWYACGDSFTHGDFSGMPDIYDETLYDPVWKVWKTYPWWIAKRNNMILHNMATNGGTLAVPTEATGTHPFSEEIYTQIGDDADYITIWYGINDCYYDALGTIDDTTSATFYGAWNKVLAYLIENHPYAKIGIVCSASNPTVGLPFREATRACAKKWGIPYLDQMGDPQVPLMLYGRESSLGLSAEALNLRKTAFTVSETNVHPNVKAHEYESTFIEHWMRSL